MRYWQKFAAVSALGGVLAFTGLGEDNGQAQALQAPTGQTVAVLNSCINQALSSGQATREANGLANRVPEARQIQAITVRDGNNWLDKQVAYNICARANGVEESPLYFSTDNTARGGLTPDGRPLVVQREVQTVPVPVPTAPNMDAYNYQYYNYQWNNGWNGGWSRYPDYSRNWSRPIPHWMQVGPSFNFWSGGGHHNYGMNWSRPIPHWAQGGGGMWRGGQHYFRPYRISPPIRHFR